VRLVVLGLSLASDVTVFVVARVDFALAPR
jgi:hypothetical protein